MNERLIDHLSAAGWTVVSIAAIYLLVRLFENKPKRSAHREAKDDYKQIVDRIRFAFNMTEIYKLQEDINIYEDAYLPIINSETLTHYVKKLRKAISERELMVRAYKKMIQQQYEYN